MAVQETDIVASQVAEEQAGVYAPAALHAIGNLGAQVAEKTEESAGDGAEGDAYGLRTEQLVAASVSTSAGDRMFVFGHDSNCPPAFPSSLFQSGTEVLDLSMEAAFGGPQRGCISSVSAPVLLEADQTRQMTGLENFGFHQLASCNNSRSCSGRCL